MHSTTTTTPPISRLKQLLINKLDPLSSTVNIHPKTHKPIRQDNSYYNNQSPSSNHPYQSSTTSSSSSSSSAAAVAQSQVWSITDRLRLWRDDARAQHLYQTAAFWGSKVYNLTSNPNDAFWLAQVFFLTGQFYRAEMVLTSAKRINPDTLEPSSPTIDCHQQDQDQELDQDHDQLEFTQDFSFWDQLLPNPNQSLNNHTQPNSSENLDHSILVRMTDYSTACRYLAAQCMIRQGKWDAALEMVGEENPFRTHSTPTHHQQQQQQQQVEVEELLSPPLPSTQPAPTSDRSKKSINLYHDQETGRAAIDGGIKFESSMCYLRGLIHLHHKALDRAKQSFLESLALDVKCYESFEALVGGNMLEPEEEWEFIQSLEYHSQTPEDALFIKSLYTVRLKKFDHKEELFESLKVLKNDYGLSDDPDAAYGLADWLYTNYRFIDCYRITSRILKLHYHHLPTLPLHLTSMTMITKLLPSLFLLAHELIEREPSSPISWYAAGLWYFSQKRWEESRRFFSKAALLDSRFPEAWFAFGHALAYEGEHDQAITAYSTASHNFQGSHLPLLFIGMQHIQLANPTLANDYLTAAGEISPSDPLVIHERGVVAYYQEQWQTAVDFFLLTLSLVQKAQTDPLIWAPTYLNLAHCYRRLKRFSDSLEAAQKAKALLPRSSTVLSALGMAHLGLNQNLEAIKYYHESLAVLPADPMTTCLLQFSLDLETTSTTSTKGEDGNQIASAAGGPGPDGPDSHLGLVAQIVPRQVRQSWNDDLRLFDLRLEHQYGAPVAASQLLHLHPSPNS